MLSVLTFNHKMHTGFFLTKVTRNSHRSSLEEEGENDREDTP